MSIYREIEETDKVFGRVRKVSACIFSAGFELRTFHFDKEEISSSISGWMASDLQTSGDTLVHNLADINEFGVTTNYINDESIDIEET